MYMQENIEFKWLKGKCLEQLCWTSHANGECSIQFRSVVSHHCTFLPHVAIKNITLVPYDFK